MRFQLQVSMIRPSVVRQVQPYLERISRPPWRLNLREDHMVNETMGFLFKCWKLLQAPRWCASGRTGRPKAWMSSRWFRSSWVEFFLRGLRVMLIDYYMSAFFAIWLCCYIAIYTIYHTLTFDNIHLIHITEFDLDVFFHQVVSICTGSMKVLRPSRQVITFSTTLTLIQQAVFHTVGRKKPLEERPFLGMWYGSHPAFHLIHWHDFLKW